jgi:tetratricopeptide (TPR) repeat protein
MLEAKVNKKRLLLEEASKYAEILTKMSQRVAPHAYWNYANAENNRALIQAALAEIEPNPEKKRKLLEKAILIMENCFALITKDLKDNAPGWKIHFLGRYYYWFGAILEQLHFLTKDKKILKRAIDAYSNATESYSKAKLRTREAEACWQKANPHDLLEDFLEASYNYESASKLFKIASEEIPQLLEFYQEHSANMHAWSEIEQAKYNHSREKYLQAEIHYENAGRLHEKLDNWNYLSSNYFAWAKMEHAEDLSRTEKSTEAIQSFRDAIDYFQKTDRNTKTKIIQNLTNKEKKLVKRIVEASDPRHKYCQARILSARNRFSGNSVNDSQHSFNLNINLISSKSYHSTVTLNRKPNICIIRVS